MLPVVLLLTFLVAPLKLHAADDSLTPPSTISVLITGEHESTDCNNDAFETREVNFKDYVKDVLANEWSATWRPDALIAGAMAVKTYAWSKILNPKYSGRKGSDGKPFHVKDSDCDQVYERDSNTQATNDAIEGSWLWVMRRPTAAGLKIFDAQYRRGTPGSPDSSPGVMSQHGSQYFALRGESWDWILHHYYDGSSPIDLSGMASLVLSPNKTTFTPGETLRVAVRARNAGPTVTIDFYLGHLLPDRHTVSLYTSLSPLRMITTTVSDLGSFRPLAAKITIPEFFEAVYPDVVVLTLPVDFPEGKTTLFAAVTAPETLRLMVPIATADFTFSALS